MYHHAVRLLRILLVAMLSTPALQAQAETSALRGTVLDTDGTALAGVNIAVLNASPRAFTGEDGTFLLTLMPGTYTLEFTRIGYAPRLAIVTAPTAAALVVELVPRTEALGELVVSTQRTDATLLDAPAAVTTLDADEIVASQTWALADLTGRVP
ncbi:MAG: carboxypeptidase regulatory-like domain-containing protein, partial [Bacteroidota bacterium]